MAFIRFVCTECGVCDQPCKHHVEQEIIRLLKDEIKFQRTAVLEIIHLLRRQSGFTIHQVEGEKLMPILGIVAGATGVFQETPTPAGSTIPAGTIPVWTSSDTTNAPVVATPDGTGCSVSVPAGAPISSFTLSVANQDGSFSTSVTVPVTQPVIAQTGFQIDQIS